MSVPNADWSSPEVVQAIRDLRAAAERLERGQGHSPITDDVETFEALLRRPPALGVVVLADRPEVRTEVAAWLTGLPNDGPAAFSAVAAELVIGPVAEPGLEAPRVGRLAEVACEPGGGNAPQLARARLACPDAQPTALLITDHNWADMEVSTLLDRMGRRPTLLLIVTQGDLIQQPGHAELLGLLASAATAWAPLTPPGIAAPAAALQLPGVRTAPIALGDAAGRDRVIGPGSIEVRRTLLGAHLVRRSLAALEIIQERRDTEARQLAARQKREQQRQEPGLASAETGARQSLDSLKAVVADEVLQLTQALRERGRRLGLRNTGVLQQMDEQLQNLCETDLDQDPVGRKIRLSLNLDIADQLKGAFVGALHEAILADCAEVRQAADQVKARLAPALDSLGFAPNALQLVVPRPEQIWGPIEESLHIHVRYRGEIQRRGLVQRLGEGRRVVFLVLMVLSLFGGFVGVNIRRSGALAPLFAVLFLGAVIYTFFSWRKEERINYDDELIRLRDLLTADFARLLTDALRERQARMQFAVEEFRREALISIDGLQRDLAQVRTRELESDRKLGRAREKMVDQRLRDLQALAAPLLKARQALEAARGLVDRRFAAAPAPVPTAPAATGAP